MLVTRILLVSLSPEVAVKPAIRVKLAVREYMRIGLGRFLRLLEL